MKNSSLGKFSSLCAVTAACLLLCSCTIKQEVKPIPVQTQNKDMCVVDSPDVREGFKRSLVKELQVRGYNVTTVNRGSNAYQQCSLITEYRAKWSWDFTIYLAYADIRVFQKQNGVLNEIGSALYDARSGSGSFSKFVDGEDKVRELVEELFP